MQQESTYPVEFKSPLKRALEKAELGCRVSSACPESTLIVEVEFFWMTVLLSITPTRGNISHLQQTEMRQQFECVVKSLGRGTQGVFQVCAAGPSITGTQSSKREVSSLLSGLFPAHLLHEHLLLFQVLDPDYLI